MNFYTYRLRNCIETSRVLFAASIPDYADQTEVARQPQFEM